MLDLPEGPPPVPRGVARVQSADLCTSCNPDLFFSHSARPRPDRPQAGVAWADAVRFPVPDWHGLKWPS